MPITQDMVRALAADLYNWSLRKVPDDTRAALETAQTAESSDTARETLKFMLASARRAEREDKFLCSDAGVPAYFVKIGAQAQMTGDIAQAFVDGFDDLVQTIRPPILKFVTNPLTNERGYRGKDMPLVSYDLTNGDFLDITCSPKALGSGRWAALEIFSSPSLETIEAYVMDVVLKAAGQHCPPVVIGVGIGGSFDHAAKIAKKATLRPLDTINPEPALRDMEARLLDAVNATGFGPMGVGGRTTALGVHVDYSAGHGFTPVAVCFNCWINRRTRARIYNSGAIERME